LSLRRQCELIGLSRASWYYAPKGESLENLRLMRLLDEQYLRTPFYGVRRMTAYLREATHQAIDDKRVRRLLRLMGLQALYPKPRTTLGNSKNQVFPYLLRGVEIVRPNQVWSADITYVPMRQGFMYLVAILDWYSRYVIAWELANTLEGAFCLTALETALQLGKPEIFNTDQGVQFTAQAFTGRLQAAAIRISMDGRGRAFDNIFVERLWRTVKYEHLYLYDYSTVPELLAGLTRYWHFYNHERLHQSLAYRTPAAVYSGCL
jgi:putative transposase